MKPFKPFLVFSMAAVMSILATGCVSVEDEYDDDDDDDDGRRRRSSTTTTTVEERRLAPAATQETRVIRSY